MATCPSKKVTVLTGLPKIAGMEVEECKSTTSGKRNMQRQPASLYPVVCLIRGCTLGVTAQTYKHKAWFMDSACVSHVCNERQGSAVSCAGGGQLRTQHEHFSRFAQQGCKSAKLGWGSNIESQKTVPRQSKTSFGKPSQAVSINGTWWRLFFQTETYIPAAQRKDSTLPPNLLTRQELIVSQIGDHQVSTIKSWRGQETSMAAWMCSRCWSQLKGFHSSGRWSNSQCSAGAKQCMGRLLCHLWYGIQWWSMMAMLFMCWARCSVHRVSSSVGFTCHLWSWSHFGTFAPNICVTRH